MTWGIGKWGAGDPWGADLSFSPPSLVGIFPTRADVLGGTVIRLVGENFVEPFTLDVILAGDVVGQGYLFDGRYDIRPSYAYVGLPPLDEGTYDLRVSTPGGVSPVLPAALIYRRFAGRSKVQRVRSGMAQPWNVGRRMLTTNAGE